MERAYKKVKTVHSKRKRRSSVRDPVKTRGKRSASLRRRNVVSSGVLGVENKWVDNFLLGSTISNSPGLTGGEMDPSGDCICPIPNGDDYKSRDGRTVILTSLMVDGWVEYPPGVGLALPSVAPDVFIALVLDTQTNGLQLQSEDVYTNPAADTNLSAMPFRNKKKMNTLNRQRYKVLKTWHFTMARQTLAHQAAGNLYYESGVTKRFHYYKTFEIPQSYSSDADPATVGQIQDNSFHLIAFSDAGGLDLAYNARVTFRG